MVFGNQFSDLFGNQGLFDEKVSISKNELKKLEAIVEKYEALAAKHKDIQSKNDSLLKKLDDLKEDARKFKEQREDAEKYIQSLIRVQADFQNYKKISERDNQRYKEYAMEKILTKLIKHLDDLNRAYNILEALDIADSVKEGFKMLVNNFEKLLAEEGVKSMSSEGEQFDPYKHEALLVQESNLPENTIIEELDKGYFFNNKILRPAKVVISKNS